MNHAFKNCRMLCVYVYHHTFIESESFKNLIPCKYTCVETGKVHVYLTHIKSMLLMFMYLRGMTQYFNQDIFSKKLGFD